MKNESDKNVEGTSKFSLWTLINVHDRSWSFVNIQNREVYMTEVLFIPIWNISKSFLLADINHIYQRILM
jgi:hypothetical protein